MATQLTGREAPNPASPEPKVATIAGWEHRLETLDARVERLEKALEGLQDALYRHEVLQDKNDSELRKRTEPEQLARDLSEDARRRGL